MTFTVDGLSKQFDDLPAAENRYMKISSTIKARPAPGSKEGLTINFLSIDLRALTYPVDVPLPRDFSKAMSPMAAMATVGFIYIDEQGREWAGPGSIRIDSFGADGVLAGTFTNVSIPHVDKKLPNVLLTAGSVRVRIVR